eukprot:766556-Hanusia_phi.AAC.2
MITDARPPLRASGQSGFRCVQTRLNVGKQHEHVLYPSSSPRVPRHPHPHPRLNSMGPVGSRCRVPASNPKMDPTPTPWRHTTLPGETDQMYTLQYRWISHRTPRFGTYNWFSPHHWTPVEILDYPYIPGDYPLKVHPNPPPTSFKHPNPTFYYPTLDPIWL